ncbi:conserved hypothetical protein [Perkinsus marinus ATCC 50983]|uniref:Nuclease S1 n=1 Tax=Perkinsus marinus (strain ATCC 50983 / TXsc) TaxID=423536 RepID=C5LKE6_PERM5|nr:conserved hypothetical protein [Perkinsus marinus ATCC 50983]EER02780.1 conserved hypothetical protein [Perkinsus marinus ATCC 50983]|eukprot:XP_002770964.1 conserved hypothetical protein [Perkinsus marinus ATCC 50983]
MEFPLLSLLLSLSPVLGSDFHAVVVELADLRLADKTRQELSIMLGNDYRLSTTANWAARLNFPWLADLSTAYNDHCNFSYARDCTNNGRCLAGSIWNYTNRMIDPYLSTKERSEAVKFLVHLVADAHLPLSAGRSSDQGGKKINVHINFADFSNVDLSKAWREKILDEMQGALYPGKYVQQDSNSSSHRMKFWRVTSNSIGADLDQKYAGMVPSWLAECTQHGINACIDMILNEAADLACRIAYRNMDGRDIQNNDDLSREYYTSRIGMLREQLAKAATRLGWIMDEAFKNYTGVTTTVRPVTTAGPVSPSTTTTKPKSNAIITSPFIMIYYISAFCAYALI